MKEHMSITIDSDTAARLRKHAVQEKRAVSQVVEFAVESFLSGKGGKSGGIVTTKGAFQGIFSREETYSR